MQPRHNNFSPIANTGERQPRPRMEDTHLSSIKPYRPPVIREQALYEGSVERAQQAPLSDLVRVAAELIKTNPHAIESPTIRSAVAALGSELKYRNAMGGGEPPHVDDEFAVNAKILFRIYDENLVPKRHAEETDVVSSNLRGWSESTDVDSGEYRQSEEVITAAIDTVTNTLIPEIERRGEYAIEQTLREAITLIRRGNPEITSDVVEIITHSSLRGIPLPRAIGMGLTKEDQHGICDRLLAIYKQDPEVAHTLVRHQIVGFHGTRSGALVGILEEGALLTQEEAQRKGRRTETGEYIATSAKGRPILSFASWSETSTLDFYTQPSKQLILPDLYGQIARIKADLQLFKSGDYSEDSYSALYVKGGERNIVELKERARQITRDPTSLESVLTLANIPIAFGLSLNGYSVYDRLNDLPDESDVTMESALIHYPPYNQGGKAGEFVLPRSAGMHRMPVVATELKHAQFLKQLFADHDYAPDIIPLEVLKAGGLRFYESYY
jgi:hypothetical protein